MNKTTYHKKTVEIFSFAFESDLLCLFTKTLYSNK